MNPNPNPQHHHPLHLPGHNNMRNDGDSKDSYDEESQISTGSLSNSVEDHSADVAAAATATADATASNTSTSTSTRRGKREKRRRRRRRGRKRTSSRENKNVPSTFVPRKWSTIVVGCALVATIVATIAATATVVYKQTEKQPTEDFQVRFDEFAMQMQEVLQLNAQNILETCTSWSRRMTLANADAPSLWPNVTLSGFEAQAEPILQRIGARQVALNPFISTWQRDAWEAYSIAHYEEWIQESYEYAATWNTSTTIPPTISIVPYINQGIYQPDPATLPASSSNGYYAPYWQMAPVDGKESQVNFDAYRFEFVPPVFQQMMETSQPVLSQAINLQPLVGNVPETLLAVPIYQDNSSNDRSDTPIVAVLTAILTWETFLLHVVPVGTVTVVVRNTCDVPDMTYTIDGPDRVKFVGLGDELHDHDALGVQLRLQGDVHEEESSTAHTSSSASFSWVPKCQPTIHVYPTDDVLDAYDQSSGSSNMASTWIVVGAVVFLVVVLVIYYECWRLQASTQPERQEKRTTVANSSHYSASPQRGPSPHNTLFSPTPETMMDDDESHHNHLHQYSVEDGEGSDIALGDGDTSDEQYEVLNDTIPRSAAPRRVKTRTSRGGRGGGPAIVSPETTPPSIFTPSSGDNLTPSSLHTQQMETLSNHFKRQELEASLKEKFRGRPDGDHDRPIADLFSNCTVLFADIVGFTSWSSVREPTAVFKLLEGIYNSFDKIAKRRKIFKVETIGDCYVAATGLPVARTDHAVAMARFSRECMVSMRRVVHKLKETLGEDTADLSMRFGLHSGAVTAGVLRSDKGRFQLFGDTISMAARIESTGARGKIHLSEETATLIFQTGKDSWVKAREERIDIKGHGNVQTFWLSLLGRDPEATAERATLQDISLGHLSLAGGDDSDEEWEQDEDMNSSMSSLMRDIAQHGRRATNVDSNVIQQLMSQLGRSGDTEDDNEPLANVFPNCTLMFGEIVGFPAWSAPREPTQVFRLLEGVYSAFDKIAKRRKVFKVETIGECYLAATGLPFARADHAVAIAKFARECMVAMHQVITDLKGSLGEDTATLGMRFGLHSGPVTAGVLRGEKSRFQVFGDTVNTASRMETTAEKNTIQLSEETAVHIFEAGNDHWLQAREERVEAKGKGKLQTYWLSLGNEASPSIVGTARTYNASFGHVSFSDSASGEFGSISASSMDDVVQSRRDEKLYGLIDSSVDVLERLLVKIVAVRGVERNNHSPPKPLPEYVKDATAETILDEMQDIITLPGAKLQFKINPSFVSLEENVVNQLRDYVSLIAYRYSEHFFHSFEHANHVAKSMDKLFARTSTPERMDYVGLSEEEQKAAKNLEEYTYKITSNPLTQFALVFAALIHDVEHPGVPNAQLVKEQNDLAVLYNNRCIAEQNSVDIAWEMLMEPCYADLRGCIYKSQEELSIFRQLVVNSVLATDLFDKELGWGRKSRWRKAFVCDDISESSFNFSVSSLDSSEDMDLKATVILEYMMQAADVIHTMQNWNSYVTWNEKLFHECYRTYIEGRSNSDPTDNWYFGEIVFFDSYVIPLATKLSESCLFGYSGGEWLKNAKTNRKEFEMDGKHLVEMYLKSYPGKH